MAVKKTKRKTKKHVESGIAHITLTGIILLSTLQI